MSFTVDVAFVHAFDAAVHHIFQKTDSIFPAAVRVKQTTGKTQNFERLDRAAAVKRTTRHGQTPLLNPEHTRRRATLEDYDGAVVLDSLDDIKMLISAESEYNKVIAAALSRAKDQVVITAFNAASTAVAADDTTSGTALPAGQIIANGGTGMTLAKWRQAKRIMDANSVPASNRYIALSPIALNDDLLADTNVTSADFNSVRALVNGELNTFLGFQVMMEPELLPISGNIRSLFAWQSDAMGLAMGQDIRLRMTERADLNYAMQVYGNLSLGAVRVDDRGVVQIDIDESV